MGHNTYLMKYLCGCRVRVRVCVCSYVCVCSKHIFAIHYAHITVCCICVYFTQRHGYEFFLSLVGRQKEETKDAWKKNVQHTLLRTSRPEATALYGYIFFNILARKILYYIEGKIHAQRLPSNGHVNFICFLRAHKSKKIVFYKKIYVRCPFQWPDILYILCGRRPFSADILTKRRNSNSGKYTENLSRSSINPQPPQLCMH